MTHPDFLIPGNCYFHMGFIDENLSVPTIDALIFVEKKIDETGTDYWLFQDAYTYFHKDKTEPEYLTVEEDLLHSIFDIHDLQKELNEIEDSHPIVKDYTAAGLTSIELTEDNLNNLKQQITSFLANKEIISLGIDIKYREEGFSLIRHNSILEASFWIKWKTNYQEELAIRKIFADAQITAKRDYLSQFGRRRSLSYQVAEDFSTLVDLSKELLTEAYEIKSNEQLKFYLINQNDTKKI